ncbi:hypothetical protein QBC46DRAFT_459338 [Diplogelasinospora grovesii]|uniref:Protein kinase domain-containing protein n=1 Tax=Diplogelasinospora grovesii TaxID=303347 RepID=A0AAN6N687_9PEZI|nr:hypothetical protein QBC46DRAFT_459338 [Diplogelasinospora grovesii]
MALTSLDITPVPYQPGRILHITLLKSYCSLPVSQPVEAIVLQTSSATMSVVLDLHDRRFGADLRKDHPHTPEAEAVFQSFIQQNKISHFLEELAETKESEPVPLSADYYLDPDIPDPDSRAKYETALWQECQELFACETQAYSRLQDLQGACIPHMYAHILITPNTPDHVTPPNRYDEVKGVLLEFIPGYTLRPIHNTSALLAPPDPQEWQGVVQSAVDTAHEINKRGIIMKDCQPRNVMADSRRSHKPFIIDLAQCRSKDEMMKFWEDSDNEVEVEEIEYWIQAITADNPGAIGSIMQTKLPREKGVEIHVKYPDIYKIIDDIKRR